MSGLTQRLAARLAPWRRAEAALSPDDGPGYLPWIVGIMAALVAALPALAPGAAFAQATCAHFAEVRAAIDNVIDKDAAKAAAFRKEFKDGADSIWIIEQMVDADMRRKVDICRYDVAVYLTKRGFPPPH